MAVAQEQENKAEVAGMRARVIEAEAQVPLAMAEAFRSDNLGIMDYYKMKNLAADTEMRRSHWKKPPQVPPTLNKQSKYVPARGCRAVAETVGNRFNEI